MKNTGVQDSEAKRIVSPKYLRFEIGDRICTQSFTTDKAASYSAVFGWVQGYMFINPAVLAVDSEWGQTGWFYWVLFDCVINDTGISSYFDFVHESNVSSPNEMQRWDNPRHLLRLLVWSLKRKFRGGN